MAILLKSPHTAQYQVPAHDEPGIRLHPASPAAGAQVAGGGQALAARRSGFPGLRGAGGPDPTTRAPESRGLWLVGGDSGGRDSGGPELSGLHGGWALSGGRALGALPAGACETLAASAGLITPLPSGTGVVSGR